MKRRCPCSAESREFERHGDIGEDSRLSGFNPVITLEGRVRWICGKCWDDAHEHAVKIVALVGDPYLHFHGLLKERTK